MVCKIGNKEFEIKKIPLTNLNCIKNKNVSNNCNKINGNIKNRPGNEKFKIEKTFKRKNLESCEELTQVIHRYAINISQLRKTNYNIHIFETWLR